MNIPKLEMIYEDNEILVCRKPAGIATQTKRLGQQDMESLLKNYRAQKGEPPYIGVVHRLDQPVEGIMVFAKTPHAAAELSKQVRQRDFGKHYLAIAPAPADGRKEAELTDYLVADKKNNTTRVVPKGTAQAQLAKLEYKIVHPIAQEMVEDDRRGNERMATPGVDSEQKELALYDILLHTGRHHQIRVQFAHMGCPLLGDAKYGGLSCTVGGEVIPGASLALCSYRVEFAHPSTGKRMDFSIKPENPVFRERITTGSQREEGGL